MIFFDYEAGFMRHGGDLRAYEKTLRTFLDRAVIILDCIADAYRLDSEIYRNLIRLMRIDLEDIMALRLASMAQVLEKAAKHRRRIVLEEDHDIFTALSYLLCAEVRQALMGFSGEAELKKKEAGRT
jgi:hypothetical protein